MTTGWETKPLGEVCDIRNGLWKGKKEPFVQAGVIRNTNFSKDGSIDSSNIAYLDVESRQLEKRRLADGDIVLEKSGGGPKQAVGRVAYFEGLEGEFSFSNFTSAIRVLDAGVLDSRFLHRFLYWMYVSGITERMQSHSTGIRNLNLSAYKQIEVPLPPLEEQKRIVAILDAAFADIDQLSWNVVRKLATADELFESILEAALDGVTDGWPETTLAVEVNEGHCDLLAGFAFKSKEYSNVEGDVRLLRGDNIVPGSLRWDGVKRIAADRFEKFERYELREDDIVLAMDRPWVSAGLKLAVVAPNDLPALLVQRVARLRFGPTWDPLFAQYTLRQRRFSDHLLSAQTGVGVPHISASQIKDFSIWKPPVTVQREVGRRVRAAQEHCAQVRDRAVTARSDTVELRQSLLHQAFSGQL